MEPSDPQVKLSPGLYLVATPIGNLRDVSLRALDVLGAADLIACEDTRVTKRLLDKYGISTKLAPYHEHNARQVRPRLIARVSAGEVVALVSDAGTPLISDPGFKLVRDARDAGIAVWPIPGASSVIAGLIASGLPSDRFCFNGFLPERGAARQGALGGLRDNVATQIFFESAKRLPKTLGDIAAVCPGRDIVVARELTKRFEEVRSGTAQDQAEHYQSAGPPKGEVVLLIGPAAAATVGQGDLDDALAEALSRLSVKDAAGLVSAILKRPRREVYTRALELAGQKEGG